MPLTAEARRPESRRTGPCSMCSSTEASAPSRLAVAPDAASRSTPHAARASCRRVPSLSRRSRTSSGSRVPAAAEEPRRLRPKRAPSSSAQSTRRTSTAGGASAAASARTTPSAARRPSAPSSQPPAGTASMCDPTMTKPSVEPSPGSVAQMFPAGSRSTVTGRSSSFASSQSRAACQSGVHARRRAPSGPPKRSCSSRRSARTPSTSIAAGHACTAGARQRRDRARRSGRARARVTISPRS